MHTKKEVKSLNGPSVRPKTSTKDFFPGNMVSLGKCWTLSIPSFLCPFGFSQLDIYLSIWWNKKIYCSPPPPFSRPFSVLQGRGFFSIYFYSDQIDKKKPSRVSFRLKFSRILLHVCIDILIDLLVSIHCTSVAAIPVASRSDWTAGDGGIYCTRGSWIFL